MGIDMVFLKACAWMDWERPWLTLEWSVL